MKSQFLKAVSEFIVGLVKLSEEYNSYKDYDGL